MERRGHIGRLALPAIAYASAETIPGAALSGLFRSEITQLPPIFG